MRLRRYFNSMAGRLFVLLLIGVVASATLALGLADARRQSDLKRIALERVVDRLQDFVSLINGAPTPLKGDLIAKGIPGLHLPMGTEHVTESDPDLTSLLVTRIDGAARAEKARPASCIPQPSVSSFYARIDCWVISVPLIERGPVTMVAFSPRTDSFDLPRPDAVFLSILTLGVGVLAFLVARIAAAPLRDLSSAAHALGGDLDRSPLPERGPFEVRDALRAFNLMQEKLRGHMTERTRILASITHDLQTPLTRLRLRLERVEDPALRSRLIDDLARMQVLIRQGLELSRGDQAEETFVSLALDSLLESVVEDAADGGTEVALARRCGCDVEARPNALQRCLANLLDNAVIHGGGAEVSADLQNGEVIIRIRDFGPGIPPDKMEKVFEPFFRLDRASSARGVGLGLTIARMLAEKNDADLRLANHPDGGLEARLTLRRGIVRNAVSLDPAA